MLTYAGVRVAGVAEADEHAAWQRNGLFPADKRAHAGEERAALPRRAARLFLRGP